jgi:hypothetical protein
MITKAALSSNFSTIHCKLPDLQRIQIKAMDNARAQVFFQHQFQNCNKKNMFLVIYPHFFFIKIKFFILGKKALDVPFHVVYSKIVRLNSQFC